MDKELSNRKQFIQVSDASSNLYQVKMRGSSRLIMQIGQLLCLPGCTLRDSIIAKFIHFYAQKFLKMHFINFIASQGRIHQHVSFSDTFINLINHKMLVLSPVQKDTVTFQKLCLICLLIQCPQSIHRIQNILRPLSNQAAWQPWFPEQHPVLLAEISLFGGVDPRFKSPHPGAGLHGQIPDGRAGKRGQKPPPPPPPPPFRLKIDTGTCTYIDTSISIDQQYLLAIDYFYDENR